MATDLWWGRIEVKSVSDDETINTSQTVTPRGEGPLFIFTTMGGNGVEFRFPWEKNVSSIPPRWVIVTGIYMR